jgi:hypothetical protein
MKREWRWCEELKEQRARDIETEIFNAHSNKLVYSTTLHIRK